MAIATKRISTTRGTESKVESKEDQHEHRPWTGPDSTGESLLATIKRLPGWAGDDFEEVLQDVIRSRSIAES